jgi:hypothetical protein
MFIFIGTSTLKRLGEESITLKSLVKKSISLNHHMYPSEDEFIYLCTLIRYLGISGSVSSLIRHICIIVCNTSNDAVIMSVYLLTANGRLIRECLKYVVIVVQNFYPASAKTDKNYEKYVRIFVVPVYIQNSHLHNSNDKSLLLQLTSKSEKFGQKKMIQISFVVNLTTTTNKMFSSY